MIVDGPWMLLLDFVPWLSTTPRAVQRRQVVVSGPSWFARSLGAAGAVVLGLLCASPPAGAQPPEFVPAYQPPPDPARNFPMPRSWPAACLRAPQGARCENAAVYELDRARRRSGLPPYRLPARFVHLRPVAQLLILSDLDRLAYGEPPVEGVSPIIDAWAGGPWVAEGLDPRPPASSLDGQRWYAWTSNWAQGFPDVVWAYLAWVWADGYGSGNIDCTSPTAPGCWGHRRDILSTFSTQYNGQTVYLGNISMGAAEGMCANPPSCPTGAPSDTQAFAATLSSQGIRYVYTWARAKHMGAGRLRYRVPLKDRPS